jgi:hypothetical protein
VWFNNDDAMMRNVRKNIIDDPVEGLSSLSPSTSY